MTTLHPPPTRLVSSPRKRRWAVPAALVALSAIPVLAASTRLVELSGGPALLPARLDPSPVGAGTQAFTLGIGEAR